MKTIELFPEYDNINLSAEVEIFSTNEYEETTDLYVCKANFNELCWFSQLLGIMIDCISKELFTDKVNFFARISNSNKAAWELIKERYVVAELIEEEEEEK